MASMEQKYCNAPQPIDPLGYNNNMPSISRETPPMYCTHSAERDDRKFRIEFHYGGPFPPPSLVSIGQLPKRRITQTVVKRKTSSSIPDRSTDSSCPILWQWKEKVGGNNLSHIQRRFEIFNGKKREGIFQLEIRSLWWAHYYGRCIDPRMEPLSRMPPGEFLGLFSEMGKRLLERERERGRNNFSGLSPDSWNPRERTDRSVVSLTSEIR